MFVSTLTFFGSGLTKKVSMSEVGVHLDDLFMCDRKHHDLSTVEERLERIRNDPITALQLSILVPSRDALCS